jgi:integrase
MAVKATKAGYERHGTAMLLQFDCLLRLSELIGLKRKDVIFEGDPRYPREFKGAVLCLRHTKTGQDQSVTVENPDVLRLLKRACSTLPSDDSPVFPFRADAYRRVFKRVAASLGLSSRYVPHSARHGGATRLFQRDPLSIEAIKLRGRWKSLDSAKRYIQQGVVTVAVPAAVAQLGALFSSNVWDSMQAALTQQH